MKNISLIQDIWKFTFQRKYLGKGRMKKIYTMLMEACSLQYSSNGYDEYRKSNHNEWFGNRDYEIKKDSAGKFILSVHRYDEQYNRTAERYYVFSLDLELMYDSSNPDVGLTYDTTHRKNYIEKMDAYKQIYE